MATDSMRILTIAALLGASLFVAGCVEREMTITSEPSGALVYISNVEVGRTPLKTPFTWYGDYEVILRLPEGHDGQPYETLKTHWDVRPPIYDIPPWDLLSQAMVPWTYHYKAQKNFVLKPYQEPSDEQLLDNAVKLQARNLEPVKK